MRNYFFTVIFLAASCGSPGNKKDVQPMAVCISDSMRKAGSVYLTSDEKNIPVMCWCETDIDGKKFFYLSYFDTSAAKFSAAINIPIEQNTSIHEEGMPKVAFKSDGTMIAVYETSANSAINRFAGYVHYIVSNDKGTSWTSPVRLHADTSAETSHSFAAIARLSDGEVGACWLDESYNNKTGGRPVKFAKTNDKNKFDNELVVDSVACECCRIAIASNADGGIAVAFRDIINDSIRDMSVSSSNDNGRTFTAAVSFSQDGWAINGCPHNGPSVATAGNRIYAAWFTGGAQRGVYYCELGNKKETVNKQLVSDQGRFIQLTILNDGSRVLAFNENIQEGGKSYSKIVLNKVDHDNVYTQDVRMEKSMASYPVVGSFGANNIVVAWTSNEKVYYYVSSASTITSTIKRSSVKVMPVANNLAHIKLASATDLICGMPLSLSPGDTALFRNGIYGFCSEICKKQFLVKPERFVLK